jgi:hypothetical protein
MILIWIDAKPAQGAVCTLKYLAAYEVLQKDEPRPCLYCLKDSDVLI